MSDITLITPPIISLVMHIIFLNLSQAKILKTILSIIADKQEHQCLFVRTYLETQDSNGYYILLIALIIILDVDNSLIQIGDILAYIIIPNLLVDKRGEYVL